MLNVLIAGLSAELEPWLMQRLGGVPELTLEAAHNAEETFRLLGQGKHRLLVVDDHLRGIKAGEVIAKARHELGLTELRAIYCLDKDATGRADEDLTSRLLKDDRILFHPVDQEELARDILASCASGATAKAEHETAGDDSLEAEGSALWPQFKDQVFAQLALLEQSLAVLMKGEPNPDEQKKAQREAHKLAGSLGSLGFPHGTELARQVEQALRSEAALKQSDFLRVCDAVTLLRSELEHGPVKPESKQGGETGAQTAPAEDNRPRLVIVDSDRDLATAIALEASRRGMSAEVASDRGTIDSLFTSNSSNVLLLDPAFAEGIEKGLEFLSEFVKRQTQIPVLVLTTAKSFADRLKVAQHAARGFLEKPMPAARVVDAIAHLLERRRVTRVRVLAVDDDPAILAALKRSLEPNGIVLTALSDPLQFWDALETSSPDLVLLDNDMPQITGLDLCRMLRNEERWIGFPILFLTAHEDPETLQKAFAAGADDFVAKPFVGPELLARIITRFERAHHSLNTLDKDLVTGSESLRTSIWYLDRLLRLATRRQERFCLVVLDLDDVGHISSRYGRPTSDRIYRRLNQILMGAFRFEDVVTRWEGDEFVIGLYGMAGGDAVQRLAELLETFRQEEFIADSGDKFRVTFSAGIAQDVKDGPDLQSLYRTAHEVLVWARKMGGDRILTSAELSGDGQLAAGPNVVVVDDDETLGSLLRHALTTRGYRPECFHDGRAALESLGGPSPAMRPQVLLLDVDLPNMDGLSVLRRLSEEGVVKRTRIIMLTAHSNEAEVVNALEWGAFDYIAKPFSLRVLIQRIRRAMEV